MAKGNEKESTRKIVEQNFTEGDVGRIYKKRL
jgi:hypothetical protein